MCGDDDGNDDYDVDGEMMEGGVQTSDSKVFQKRINISFNVYNDHIGSKTKGAAILSLFTGLS